jgi:hypothetical protein
MTTVRPHELVLDQNYFRDVLHSMRSNIPKKELRCVRFGLTGDGIAPNYEITFPDGDYEKPFRLPISGLTHKTHHQFPANFEEENLTEKFTWDDVREMLKQCVEKQKGRK